MGADPILGERAMPILASWLLTFALHSTTLLFLAWLCTRSIRGLGEGVRECVWKFAAVAPVATASLQVLLTSLPLAGAVAPRTEPLSQPTWLLEAVPAVVVPAQLRALPMVAAGTVEVPRLIVTTAMVLALLALVCAARDRFALWSLLRRRTPVVDAELLRMLEDLRGAAGCRRAVRLTRCDGLGSPIAFGVLRPEICVPPTVEELEPGQRRSLLAHELGHLVHGDPLWLAGQAVLLVLFPWQLLLRVARRQLRELAEYRCDGWAAERAGSLAMAQCLVQVAAWIDAPAPATVAGMAVRGSMLESRVDRLLGSTPIRGLGRHRFWLGPLLLASALALTAAMPAPGFDPPGGAATNGNTTRARGPAVAAQPGEPVALDQQFRDLAADVADVRRELAGVEIDPELAAMLHRLELHLARLEELRRRLPVSDTTAAPDAARRNTPRKDR